MSLILASPRRRRYAAHRFLLDRSRLARRRERRDLLRVWMMATALVVAGMFDTGMVLSRNHRADLMPGSAAGGGSASAAAAMAARDRANREWLDRARQSGRLWVEKARGYRAVLKAPLVGR